MDVKSACNSMLKALQVADALVAGGQYQRDLIASGSPAGGKLAPRCDGIF